jgi:hypothetical protein
MTLMPSSALSRNGNQQAGEFDRLRARFIGDFRAPEHCGYRSGITDVDLGYEGIGRGRYAK